MPNMRKRNIKKGKQSKKRSFFGAQKRKAFLANQRNKQARKKGVWGLGKKTKITKTGNSLAVRIPKEIANFLNLKEGKEAYMHPEKDNKLIIEAS
ncbi:AbrB/MazE/SpoVT family DNA-binding domain-containing protein [Candidatus Woesearchaeota archaeon]|nr:AbrB/MazE/SpoVT family DNA-binding domain-containing protein [Candidatus Woesearchaeota archaeon]